MNNFIANMRKRYSKANRKGLNLIELTLVLALIATIGFLVFRQYSSTVEANRIQEETSQVGQVRAAVENLYASQTNYDNLDNAAIIKGLPKSMVDETANTITNPFGGFVEVASADVVGTADGFTITIDNLSDTACQRLSSSDFGRNVKYVNIGAVATNGANEGSYTPADAATACTSGSAGNTVSWLFQ
jgi:Tfp pilus assembly protein PilE